MAGFYKNMMLSTIEDSITDLCGPYCEPEKNQLGFCPTSCIPFCYPICNRPFLNAIPPTPKFVAAKTTHQVHPTTEEHVADAETSLFLLLFLSLLIIGLVIFICYASSKFCKAWVESRREAAEEDENAPPLQFLDQEHEGEVDNPIWHVRTDGLHSSEINSITVFKYKKNGGLIEGTECSVSSVSSVCSVCLGNFQEDETLRLLPQCSHAFHVPCIDTWLKSHRNCPVCRADIVLPPLPSSPPETPNSGVDSEEFPNQEGAETETNEVGFQRGSEYESVELSGKQ